VGWEKKKERRKGGKGGEGGEISPHNLQPKEKRKRESRRKKGGGRGGKPTGYNSSFIPSLLWLEGKIP